MKENNKKTAVTRATMNEFLENIASAIAVGPVDDDMPWIEAPRDVIEHFNRGSMGGVDKAGYFIFQGVKVYEQGKAQSVRSGEKTTTEEVLFGTAK